MSDEGPDIVNLNDRGTIERAVIQALRCCITAHGPITAETSMSAAKRVIGWLKHYNQQEQAKHGINAQLTAVLNDRARLKADLAACQERAARAEAGLASLRRAAKVYARGHGRDCQKGYWDDGPCGCGFDALRKEMDRSNG